MHARAAWLGCALLACGGSRSPDAGDDSGEVVDADIAADAGDSGATADAGVGYWDGLAASPLAARADHAGVWTGSEMIIWGGMDGEGDCWRLLGDGAAYDPEGDSWRLLAEPGRRAAVAAAFWTGEEVLVWGGGEDGCAEKFEDPPDPLPPWGARYRPETDRWEPVSTDGAPESLFGRAYVWTGAELFVWGGWDSWQPDGPLIAARYSPATDAWAPISDEGAPSPRPLATAVWTGSEVIVWGGRETGGQGLADGARYDPVTDSWRPMSSTGVHVGPASAAVWTGAELLTVVPGTGSDPGGFYAYDPSGDRWRSLQIDDDQSVETALWTGAHAFVWGGYPDRDLVGGIYDPDLDEWEHVSLEGSLPAVTGFSMVWTGAEVIVWGGEDEHNRELDHGARFEW